MYKLAAVLTLAVAFTVATPTAAAAAEEKLLGVVEKIALAKDGNSAVATLKSKTGQSLEVAVEDKLTLEKLKDHRINVGDEIKARYQKNGSKNLATYFKKAGGC